ncbi:MAG: hypothetical protein CMJ59_00135 [Planctomycetaceae bacterium]|nr:hypothetical protein [Planctomycetaceae bacterium]
MRAEKALLPHPKPAGPQNIMRGVRLAPNGTIYVRLTPLICKSTDGGRNWTHHREGPVAGDRVSDRFTIRPDGAWISLDGPWGSKQPIAVLISNDEGRDWRKLGDIELPAGHW